MGHAETQGPNAKLLECDQELGLRVPAADIGRAREELVVPVKEMPCGTWDVPSEVPEHVRLGYLIVDGLLSHELLGHLVGVQRASVTTALTRIAPSGLVVRRSDGTWLLRGDPPSELGQIHWQERGRLSGSQSA